MAPEETQIDRIFKTGRNRATHSQIKTANVRRDMASCVHIQQNLLSFLSLTHTQTANKRTEKERKTLFSKKLNIYYLTCSY